MKVKKAKVKSENVKVNSEKVNSEKSESKSESETSESETTESEKLKVKNCESEKWKWIFSIILTRWHNADRDCQLGSYIPPLSIEY